MVVLEERLGEKMMIKKLNKVPYILERGRRRRRRRRRGSRCVIRPPAGESLPMRSLQITEAIE
jgi:hypothetical protein